MGEVCRGRDSRLQRDVAIKWLRSDLAADGGTRARFEDEARSAARLNHPSIVAVYDSGEWEGVPFLVMECLPGRTLADELAAGPMSPSQARQIALDVAEALDAAHRVGVIHRDVKPGNILLTAEGRAKLADFGIAKSTESLHHTQSGQIIGTPSYLAPERLEGRAATTQSDVYSWGVVLYEALTGERPFRGETPAALAHAIHATDPVPLRERVPDVEPSLARVIEQAMAKDPAARPPSGAALVALLAGGSPTSPLPETRVMGPPSTAVVTDAPAFRTRLAMDARAWWLRRKRVQSTVMAAAVVAAVLAFALVAISARGGTTDEPPANTAPTTASERALPPALDEAIDALEDSVQP